jgi:excinuclease ABC subunit A
VKLAAHLALASCAGTLFILDEPTTGLHFDDIPSCWRRSKS